MSLTSVLVSTLTLCSHLLQAWPHSRTLVAVMYSFPSTFCHFGLSGGSVSEVPGGGVGMVQGTSGHSPLGIIQLLSPCMWNSDDASLCPDGFWRHFYSAHLRKLGFGVGEVAKITYLLKSTIIHSRVHLEAQTPHF